MTEVVTESLFQCAVPGCRTPAPRSYIAETNGQLGALVWKAGDDLLLCWPHANPLFRKVP